MSLQDLANIEFVAGHNPQPKCPGTVYRYSINCFISTKRGSIVSKHTLIPIKKYSCKGCESCGWIDEYLQESMYNDTLEDLFSQVLKEDHLYYIDGRGGTRGGYFSEFEDDFEIFLAEYTPLTEETTNEKV